MIYTIVLIFVSIIVLGYLFNKDPRFFAVLLLYNIGVDFISGFVESGNYFGSVRHLLNLAVILYFITRRHFYSHNVQIVIFVVYVLFLLMGTNSLSMNQITDLLPFISALLIYNSIYTLPATVIKANLYHLNNAAYYSLIILPIYILFANVFNFGESYSEDFTAGFLLTSKIYIIPVLISIVLFNRHNYLNWMKRFTSLIIVVNTVLLLIDFRRTAIIAVFLVFFIYLFNNRYKIKAYLWISFAFFGIISLLWVFQDVFFAQLLVRERITEVSNYQTEGRFLELQYYFDQLLHTDDYMKTLFGFEFLDSVDFGFKYFDHGRTIHSDLINISYSFGIVGLVLFVIVLLKIFRGYFKKSRYLGKKVFSIKLNGVFISMFMLFVLFLIPGRLIGSYTVLYLIVSYIAFLSRYKQINQYESISRLRQLSE